MAAITAAVTNVGAVKAYCPRVENLSRAAQLKLGLDGQGFAPTTGEAARGVTAGSIARQALDMALDGYTTFDFQAVFETNDALIINLSNLTTGLGIDFLTVSTYRRVSWEIFANADADVGMVRGDAIVQGATTPIVASTLQTAVADVNGIVTIETGRLKSVAAGDLLASAAVIPFGVLSQSTNDIIMTLTGISNIDVNATVRLYVYPLEAQALFVTD